ncbi:MAG TPA: class I SAM-dependent methyltransferase, partial [Arcobacter sp.]|nr:class I SAM-dependent methyltransferase [Arcobacter sp.]
MNNKIIEANIEVHTKMADSYNNEPHFKMENQNKVKNILIELQKSINGKNLLDVGCGTGFIINLAKDLFEEIHGIDATQAMLDKVDISSGNITLHNGVAENLPFDNETFNMVSSYAFLHHLEDYSLVLKEVYRVLKNGGIYYIDLDPNKHFWDSIAHLDKSEQNKYSKIVQREIDSVLHTDEKVMEEFGIEPEIFNNAEYTKSILGGIDPEVLKKIALEIGYSKVEYKYDWFLGQGNIMHEHSFDEATKIDNFL